VNYARLVGQLARLTARIEAQRAEADSWRAEQCAAADRAVGRAEAAVREAENEVRDARGQIEAVDAAAMRLWRELARLLGPHDRRLGDAPGPVPGATASPAALLDGVRELLARARRPATLPSGAYPLMAVFGILGAGAASALALAARLGGARYGGDLAVGLPVLGLVITLLGPAVGLVPAKLLADRRHAILGPRAAVVVMAAGLAATAVLFVLSR